MKHHTLSLCMIVKNEEKNLARCLESAKDIVDEIIIVDTGSTDRTVSIAEEYNAKIFNYSWNGDFSKARNYALTHATGDFILSLDADEWLLPDSKPILLDALDFDYYYLRIRNIIRSGIVESHSFIRLFRRSVGFQYEGAIHEQINVSNYPDKKGAYLQVFINHDGYTLNTMAEKNKYDRNMTIIEKELEEKPSAFGYFNLGTQYKLVGNLNKAIEAYKKSYALGSDRLFVHKLIVYLIQCLSEQKRYDDAINILNDSIELYPDYTDFHYYLGTIYTSLGYFKDAEICFLKCLELGEVQNYLFTSFEGVGTYMANAYLGKIYLEMSQKDKAQKHLLESIKQNPQHVASLKMWLDMYLSAKPQDILRHLLNIYPLSSSEQASILMQTLYQLRNPLFTECAKLMNSNFDSEISAWLLQLNKEWESAKQVWKKCESITPGSYREIFFLAVLTEDTDFYDKFGSIKNLRKKDHQFLKRIIKREEIKNGQLSKELISTIGELFFDLLILQQYQVIEYFMNEVSMWEIRYELASKLRDFQFNELALECLIEPDEFESKVIVYSLAGDILRDLNQLGDSFHYYNEANRLKPSFNLNLKIYQMAELIDDFQITTLSLEQMRAFTPASPWANELVTSSFKL